MAVRTTFLAMAAMALLAAIVEAHSWADCVDWRFNDPKNPGKWQHQPTNPPTNSNSSSTPTTYTSPFHQAEFVLLLFAQRQTHRRADIHPFIPSLARKNLMEGSLFSTVSISLTYQTLILCHPPLLHNIFFSRLDRSPRQVLWLGAPVPRQLGCPLRRPGLCLAKPPLPAEPARLHRLLRPCPRP